MLINFPYIKRDSLIHRLDPRTKVLLLLIFSLTVVQTSNFWVVLTALIIAFFYYSQAHLRWSETKQTWRFIIVFVTILTFVNYFISGGAVVQGVDLTHQHILRSEEHTSELQSHLNIVCRLLLEKKKQEHL